MTGHRILIVDDDPAVLRTLKRTLSDKYEVSEATSLNQAQELLESNSPSHPYAAILVDQHLGDGYGNNLLLQAKHLSPNSTRIIISGADDQIATKEAINKKLVDHYIAKNKNVIENVLSVCDLATDKYEISINEQRKRHNELIKHHQAMVEERKQIILKHVPTAAKSVSFFEQIASPPLSAINAWVSLNIEKRYQASIDDYFHHYANGNIDLSQILDDMRGREFSANAYKQSNFRNPLYMISTDTRVWRESHTLILADVLGILDRSSFPIVQLKE